MYSIPRIPAWYLGQFQEIYISDDYLQVEGFQIIFTEPGLYRVQMSAFAPPGTNFNLGGDRTRLCLARQAASESEIPCGSDFASSRGAPVSGSPPNTVGSLDLLMEITPTDLTTPYYPIATGSRPSTGPQNINLTSYLQIDRLS